MNFLLIEGDSPFWRGFVIEEWKRMPHRILLLSEAPQLWRHDDFDAVAFLPVSEGEIDAAALRELIEPFGPPGGALTLFAPAIGRTLEVQLALDLKPLSDLDPEPLTNYASRLEALRRAGLPVPRSVSGTERDLIVDAARSLVRLPMAVHPMNVEGRHGSSLVQHDRELIAAVDRALGATVACDSDGFPHFPHPVFARAPGAVVREHLPGQRLVVDGLCSLGEPTILGLAEALYPTDRADGLLGLVAPARISDGSRKAVIELARAAAEALFLLQSFFRVDIVLAERGPVVTDVRAGLPGGPFPRLLEVRHGLRVAEAALHLAAGHTPPPAGGGAPAAAIRLVTAPGTGTLGAIRFPPLGEGEELCLAPRPGERVVAAPGVPIGYVLVPGTEPEDTLRRANALAASVALELEAEESRDA